MKNLFELYNLVDYFIVAHRGASGTAPENTLASFSEAIESGAHFIELDVQFTSDAVPIVFHDKGLSRTTNGMGFASKMTFSQLRQLDTGKWFSSKFEGEKIPTLKEVFELIHNKILLNLEIKNLGDELEKKINNIVNLIKEYDYIDKVVISSFYYDFLLLFKKLAPKIPTALIRIPRDKTLPSSLATKFKAEGFVCSVEELNETVAQDAKEHGLFVGVYSVDDDAKLEYVLNFDIKAIVTNYPKKIIQTLKDKYQVRI
ncbi:MAG: glycerophosphodiester phosphodiesterase family protein [Ignavibacteria bacterium]|nr:glycerophosphodiester phosphodiesterase family protein [Ignavibacteria bacterium]